MIFDSDFLILPVLVRFINYFLFIDFIHHSIPLYFTLIIIILVLVYVIAATGFLVVGGILIWNFEGYFVLGLCCFKDYLVGFVQVLLSFPLY